MKRLTERFSNGQAAVYGCGDNCKYDFKYCYNACEDCPTINEIYEKLAGYEDLEEQGLLLKLPCKIGDTVYRVSRHGVFIDSCNVTGFAECDSEKSLCYTVYIDPDEEDIILLSDFGKTVFLTQAQADEALKRMEREV